MVAYNVLIESGEEKIEFNKESDKEGQSITKVRFKMNTLNDDTLNRDSAVRCELEIEGMITKQNKKDTMKLAQWSMLNSGDALYRTVTVTVFTDDGRDEVLREYKVEKMFCIDYDEEFIGKSNTNEKLTQNEAGRFTLHIAQREGNHSKDVYID